MTGKQECTFDPKGRLIVPAKYREELGAQFYITPGLDGCLSVYPAAKWETMMEKMNAVFRVEQGEDWFCVTLLFEVNS